MSERESNKSLREYLIRPKSLELSRVLELQERVNNQLVGKKLLGECALLTCNGPTKMVQTDLGYPAIYIMCTQELALLIANMTYVFRVEPAMGQFRNL